MMPLLPAMVLITMTISAVFMSFRDSLPQSRGTVIGSNLALYHEKAVEEAMTNDMDFGIIGDPLVGPFRKMSEWTSQVFSSGHRTVVVTYLAHGPQGAESSLLQAFSEVSQLRLRALPESYSGTYVYSDTGFGGTIGGGDFSDMDLPLPANGPAIITVIDQNYVP